MLKMKQFPCMLNVGAGNGGTMEERFNAFCREKGVTREDFVTAFVTGNYRDGVALIYDDGSDE